MIRRPPLRKAIALLSAGLAAAFAHAQAPATPRVAAPAASPAASVNTAPVKARLWIGETDKTVTLVGLAPDSVVIVGDSGAAGGRIELAKIVRAEFILDYDRFEVARAMRKNDWATAIRTLKKVLDPTLPYLNLPDNNAADLALELGTYMIRAAERSQRFATTDAQRETMRKQYEAAIEVFKSCARVTWSSVGQLGVLKGCRCQLAIGKPKTARYYIEQMDEPAPGDAAFGHYWLVRGEIAASTGDYRTGIDAAVKSVCFENKDVETFPDALLLSARCYEELFEAHRARDVYFEIAKLFPRTDWSEASLARLKLIMASGKTKAQETSPIENVFFAVSEDMNVLVEELLAQADKPVAPEDEDDLPPPPAPKPDAPPPE